MKINQQQFTSRKATVCSLTLALFFCGCAVAQTKPACLTPGYADKHSQANKFILISVNAEGKPEFNNAACPGNANAKDGDICNGQNEKPDIRFILTGEQALKWKFVDFQLSGDGQKWPGELPKGAYSDFEFATNNDLDEGRPFRIVNGNTMHIQNNNCYKYTVHYKLTLENLDTKDKKIVDPIMDNTGAQ